MVRWLFACVAIAVCFGCLTASTAGAAPQGGRSTCPAVLASHLEQTGGGEQLVTVIAPRSSSSTASVETFERIAGCWVRVGGPYPALVGVHGLSAHHHEGDGTTPEGLFGFGPTMYGTAPNPGLHYPYVHVVCGDWWDEDSASPQYNLFVAVRCGVNPPFNNGSSEALWTESNAYPSLAVIGYNLARTPGAGSAIFLHASTGKPTTGCVSMARGALDAVLDWLDPSQHAHIAIGTLAAINGY